MTNFNPEIYQALSIIQSAIDSPVYTDVARKAVKAVADMMGDKDLKRFATGIHSDLSTLQFLGKMQQMLCKKLSPTGRLYDVVFQNHEKGHFSRIAVGVTIDEAKKRRAVSGDLVMHHNSTVLAREDSSLWMDEWDGDFSLAQRRMKMSDIFGPRV